MNTAFLKKYALPILIFFLALSVRTYHLESTLTFLEDEGRDMLIAYRMLDTHRPVLLGPQTSTGDMYLGPFYYYFITPALYLGRLSPLGPAMLIAITGALTALGMYLIGKAWFGRVAGILGGLLYALMPLPVVFTRNSWNPNLVPLISLTLIYVTLNLIEKPKQNNSFYLWLGGLAGVLIQLHYMSLLFIGAIGLVLLASNWRELKSLLKGAILSLASFLIILSPFLVFEIRNDFVNSRALTRFLRADQVHNIRYTMPFSLWSSKVGGTTTRLIASLYGKDSLTLDPYRDLITIAVLTLIIFMFVMLLKNTTRQSRRVKVLGFLLLIPLALLGIYQENIHLHYLGFFFPLIYLLSSAGASVPRLRYFTIALSMVSLVYSAPQLLSYLRSSGTNQLIRATEVAAYIVKAAGGQPYNIVSNSRTNTTPYQYFAAISDNPPVTTRSTVVYMICQGSACTEEDISSPFIFITGPAHPTLEKYLGHPLIYHFEGKRTVVANTHVSNGVWVAQLLIE